ncbi:E3 ubiquitin-protein ligase TRIM50 [Toxocara canis]|nr:E3 ubiquitin-protein ligase TRIM50 [Toxocara canis]
MPVAKNDSQNLSQKLVSFLADGDDVIPCEVCLEPFQPIERPPKLLPCGHNFCEQCLFSLCCHQQYYLLDSINCPTCRTEFNASAAFNAPTNYDLCKMLENVQRGANVTVIHLPDAMSLDKRRNSANVTLRSQISQNSRRSSRSKGFRCADCARKLNEKHRRQSARYCIRCSGKDDCLRFSCLECCVNRHNGHQLSTFDDLECAHHKLINDLRQLNCTNQDVGKRIEESLKELKNESLAHLDCGTLSAAKQSLLEECERELNFTFSILENGDTTPLPPAVITKMRQYHFHNSAKLYKMLNFIQKCKESVNDRENRHCRLKTKALGTAQMPLTFRQSRATLEAEHNSAADSIAALITIGNYGAEASRIHEALKILSKKTLPELDKRDAFVECAKHLKTLISDETSKQSLLLFIDAYLNIFYQLNRLVAKYPRKEDTIKRRDVWKLVQLAYTELMKCASKHWPSQHPDRVDLVDDIAFLCSLYSDVCDQATITVCMIEAARARAASDSLPEEERQNQQLRLKLIDEHLLECRRVQKLQELRSTRLRGGRFRRIKRWWRRVAACFRQKKTTRQ